MSLQGFNLLSHAKCPRCKKIFFTSDIGSGWTFNLYKCDGCEQLYATPVGHNPIPKEVLNDSEVICLKNLNWVDNDK